MGNLNNGEDAFIHTIISKSPADKEIHTGIGDDCAVLYLNDTHYELLATDMLVENTHFKTGWSTAFDTGLKAVAVNVSDIIACGGDPGQILLSLAIPQHLAGDWTSELMEGIYAGSSKYNCSLAGGDTCRTDGPACINITIRGKVKKEYLKLRKGAQPGDLIYITGEPGVARAILQWYLKYNKKPPENMPAINEALHHFHAPEAETETSRKLRKITGITAMMDLSDGILADIPRLAYSSGVGADIVLDQLEINAPLLSLAKALGQDPVKLILEGGEDYNLLFTAIPDQKEAVETAINAQYIGKITSNPEHIRYFMKGEPYMPGKGGYKHF